MILGFFDEDQGLPRREVQRRQKYKDVFDAARYLPEVVAKRIALETNLNSRLTAADDRRLNNVDFRENALDGLLEFVKALSIARVVVVQDLREVCACLRNHRQSLDRHLHDDIAERI